VTVAAPVLPRTFPREHLRAWTDTDWERIPITRVPIHNLVPSQKDTSLYRLTELINHPDDYEAGRAVWHDGTLHLYDGHHHWTIDVIRGATVFPVRVVDGEGRPVTHLGSKEEGE
jgi:hypothetical protein